MQGTQLTLYYPDMNFLRYCYYSAVATVLLTLFIPNNLVPMGKLQLYYPHGTAIAAQVQYSKKGKERWKEKMRTYGKRVGHS